MEVQGLGPRAIRALVFFNKLRMRFIVGLFLGLILYYKMGMAVCYNSSDLWRFKDFQGLQKVQASPKTFAIGNGT